MKIKEAGQDVDEIIVAYDALAVVVHPSKDVYKRQLLLCDKRQQRYHIPLIQLVVAHPSNRAS